MTEIMRVMSESVCGSKVRGSFGQQVDLGSNPLDLTFLCKSCGLWTALDLASCTQLVSRRT